MTSPQANSQAHIKPAKPRLSQSGSLLLDIVRFTAAFVVLVHHFVADQFSKGWPHIGIFGHEAVCVFFVLSGFVIRFITVTRAGTIADYAIDRASRIYSVVVPALLFTVLCEAIAAFVNLALYNAIRDPFPWSMVPAQMFANMTFTSQLWGYGISPLTNDPFWSLSYEVVYYIVYALIHYRVANRWLWVGLILLVSGPNIALLFPVWMLGAWTCDLYLYFKKQATGVRSAAILFALLVAVLYLVRHPLITLIRVTGNTERVVWLTHAASGLPYFSHMLDDAGQLPWISQLSVSFFIVGTMTGAFMLLGLLALDRFHPSLPPAVTRWTRIVADSTFALYLFHLPLIILLVVLVGHQISGIGPSLAMVLGIPLIIIPIGMGCDRLKNLMRDALHRRFPNAKAPRS